MAIPTVVVGESKLRLNHMGSLVSLTGRLSLEVAKRCPAIPVILLQPYSAFGFGGACMSPAPGFQILSKPTFYVIRPGPVGMNGASRPRTDAGAFDRS